MATTYTDGVVSSDILTMETSDGVLLVDLWAEAQTLTEELNGKRLVMEEFLGYRSDMPDADQVNTQTAYWMRRGEHTRADAKALASQDLAVLMGMEAYETHLGYTRDTQVMGLSSSYLRGRIRGILEGDARNRYVAILERLFTKGVKSIVDVLTNIPVQVPSLYFGTGDTRVPPQRGQITFEDEHLHFDRTATEGSIVAADLEEGVKHVMEHGFKANPIILMNELDSSEAMAIGAPRVTPFVGNNRYVPQDDQNLNQEGALMQISIGINPLVRAIGVFDSIATIMVSEEIPQGYIFYFSHQGDLSPENPIQVSEPSGNFAHIAGLRLVRDNRVFFLQSYWERYYAVSVRNPGNGFVQQWDNWDAAGYDSPDWGDY